MVKLKVVLGVVLVLVTLIACRKDKEKSAKGVITEATMNTMMILTSKGDTLSISTLNAQRVAKDGILLGDTATVYYKEKPQHGVITATKIVVVPRRH